jgi:hypothetical protein
MDKNNLHTDISYQISKTIIFSFLGLFVFLYFVLYYKELLFLKPNMIRKIKAIEYPFVNRKIKSENIDTSQSIYKYNYYCAFNSCKMSNGLSSVERLKQIIGFGFRFIDMELEFFNNEVVITNQTSDETFYDVIKTITNFAFSNRYCSNYKMPLFCNLRIHLAKSSTSNQLFLLKLIKILKTIDDRYIVGSEYNYLFDNKNKIMNASLSSLFGKIVFICDLSNKEITDLFAMELNEYINIKSNVLTNTCLPSDCIVFQENTIYECVHEKYTNVFRMIYPQFNGNIIINPSSIYQPYYNITSIDFSKMSSFENYQTNNDDNLIMYLDDMNMLGAIHLPK